MFIYMLPGILVILVLVTAILAAQIKPRIKPNTYIAVVENSYCSVGTRRVFHKFILPDEYVGKVGPEWYYLNRLDSTGLLLSCYALNAAGFVDHTAKHVDTSFKSLTHL